MAESHLPYLARPHWRSACGKSAGTLENLTCICMLRSLLQRQLGLNIIIRFSKVTKDSIKTWKLCSIHQPYWLNTPCSVKHLNFIYTISYLLLVFMCSSQGYFFREELKKFKLLQSLLVTWGFWLKQLWTRNCMKIHCLCMPWTLYTSISFVCTCRKKNCGKM